MALTYLEAGERLLGIKPVELDIDTDQAIKVPPGRKLVTRVVVYDRNTGITPATGAGGLYTAASKGGTAIVANSQAYTGLSADAKAVSLTLATTTDTFTGENLYLSLTTPCTAGSGATMAVYGLVLPSSDYV